MTNPQKVRKLYPTAVVVKTLIRGYEEYRVWPTGSFFEVRCIGKGKTERAAWSDAVAKIETISKHIFN